MLKLIVFCLLVVCFIGLNADDRIVNLPGLPPVNFSQYAGYINVDAKNGRNLFYWFVESQRNPATDKLVLWLNGGPGCSSIGGGLLSELGPFHPKHDGSLYLNPSSWNQIANVIFLESPAGVGWSYSDTTSDYNVGDERTANDTYTFLLGFFERYPQYANRTFWIAGESYGGHYVPEAANRILQGNAQKNAPFINLEGIMVGNAWTYMPIDNKGAVTYWWTHALISDETYQGILNNCDFFNIGPLKRDSSPQDICDNYLNTANNEMGNINIYDIYVDVCTSLRTKKYVNQLARAGSRFHKVMATVKSSVSDYEPCIDEYVTAYMNDPSVATAIHANTKLPYKWNECSNIVNYNYSDVEKSVMPLYDVFKEAKLKVLVYSGDVDAIVPVTGTRDWLSQLKRTVITPWAPWTLNGQVGGYVTVYDGLTFKTVRNAGHMVPETQPERAYAMFADFLYP